MGKWGPESGHGRNKVGGGSARWLRDIHDYMAGDNPTAAANVAGSIYEKAQLLKEQPEIEHE